MISGFSNFEEFVKLCFSPFFTFLQDELILITLLILLSDLKMIPEFTEVASDSMLTVLSNLVVASTDGDDVITILHVADVGIIMPDVLDEIWLKVGNKM